MGFAVFSAYFEKVINKCRTGRALLTISIARSSSIAQWVCNSYLLPCTINTYISLCSIVPSVTSLACTRVILALRGLLLHSDTENPPPYAPGTLPSYHDPSSSQKDYLRASRSHDRQTLSLDFFVSEPGGTTTSAELTTFGDTTIRMEGCSSAGFIERPPNAPEAQSACGASAHATAQILGGA